MLTSYKDIMSERLHRNRVWTSLTLPRKIFDPYERMKDLPLFIVEVDGITYYRWYEGTKDWEWEWNVDSKWVIEKRLTVTVNGGNLVDSKLIPFEELKASMCKLHINTPQIQIPKKEEETNMKQAVITGAKLALANEAGDVAVNMIVDMVPAIAPHLENPAARALAKILGAFVLSHSADVVGAEHAKTARMAAELVTTAATMELTQSQLKKLTPAIEQFVQLGKKLT